MQSATLFMRLKAREALEDIREDIVIAQQTVAGVTFDQFEASRILFYGVTRRLEIISEASRRLPKSLRERHKEIPWRQIMDAGNFYRHQYSNVAEQRVWRNIHESLPSLQSIIIAELDNPSEP